MAKNIIRAKITTSTGVITTQSPITLANSRNVSITGPNRLDTLADVVATSEIDGGVPVYDAATDKYIIKKISTDNLANVQIGDIDGGTF